MTICFDSQFLHRCGRLAGRGLLAFLLAETLLSQAPSPWQTVATAGISNTDEVAFARAPDGVLHVVWRERPDPGTISLMHREIDPKGTLTGDPAPVVAGWKTLAVPALIAGADGSLELLFGGVLGSQQRDDPYNQGSLYRAFRAAGSTAWELAPGALSSNRYAYLGPIAATVDSSGTRWTAWAASSQLNLQKGLEADPVTGLHGAGCCPYLPGLATDAVSGEVVAGWYSNANTLGGHLLRQVSPSLGEIVVAPGSVAEAAGRQQSQNPGQQVPLRSRLGQPGVYVAYCEGYPTCAAIDLWAFGAPKPLVVAKAAGARAVNLAAAPEGRFWVMWLESGQPVAMRSNKAADRFGPRVAFPKVAGSAYHLSGEGSLGPLDTFLNTGSEIRYTRVYPPLTLTASPRSIPSEQGAAVTFSASDVGDPVAGVEISVNGRTLTTDDAGRASVEIPKGGKPGTIAASASKEDYQKATLSLTVTAPKK